MPIDDPPIQVEPPPQALQPAEAPPVREATTTITATIFDDSLPSVCIIIFSAIYCNPQSVLRKLLAAESTAFEGKSTSPPRRMSPSDPDLMGF
jgi:hypothetical protein